MTKTYSEQDLETLMEIAEALKENGDTALAPKELQKVGAALSQRGYDHATIQTVLQKERRNRIAIHPATLQERLDNHLELRRARNMNIGSFGHVPPLTGLGTLSPLLYHLITKPNITSVEPFTYLWQAGLGGVLCAAVAVTLGVKNRAKNRKKKEDQIKKFEPLAPPANPQPGQLAIYNRWSHSTNEYLIAMVGNTTPRETDITYKYKSWVENGYDEEWIIKKRRVPTEWIVAELQPQEPEPLTAEKIQGLPYESILFSKGINGPLYGFLGAHGEESTTLFLDKDLRQESGKIKYKDVENKNALVYVMGLAA